MRKGFTLIELLIVIIIVGILATMAIPQYAKLIDKAKRVEAVTMLSSLGTASLMYYMQMGNIPSNIISTTDRDLYVAIPDEGSWAYINILDSSVPKSKFLWQANYIQHPGWKVGIKVDMPQGTKNFYEKKEADPGVNFVPADFNITDYKINP